MNVKPLKIFDYGSYNINKVFTPAEHQLIAMKLSYRVEDYAKKSKNMEEIEIENKLINEYRKYINNENIQLVKGIPQYFNETVTVTKIQGTPSYTGKIEMEVQSGFHANAITKGDPNEPGTEILVTFAGTDFSDTADFQQTFTSQSARYIDYSEKAIEYIEEIRKKYPNAKIVVDGHSMGGN